jgi:hypothetical protein
VGGRQDFEPAFFMAEFSHKLIKPLVRLRAAVAKENLAVAKALDELGGKSALRFREIKVGDVDEFFGLFDERFGDGGMAVAQAGDGDAAAEIQIAPAGDIVHLAAGAVAQDQLKPAVAGHDIFVEQLANGPMAVVDHGGWGRNHFFHWQII